MPEKNTGETFFAWEFPEYTKHHRTMWWYLGIGALGGILIIFSLLTKNYLFALIILMTAIIIFLYEAKDPLQVTFSITEDGIGIGNDFFAWKEIRNFWIIYEPPEVKNLYLDFKNVYRPRLAIPLDEQNPLKIREKLLEFIDEDLEKESEPLSDTLGRKLKL